MNGLKSCQILKIFDILEMVFSVMFSMHAPPMFLVRISHPAYLPHQVYT